MSKSEKKEPGKSQDARTEPTFSWKKLKMAREPRETQLKRKFSELESELKQKRNYSWVDLQTKKIKSQRVKRDSGVFLMESAEKVWQSATIFFKDHWHLLIRSAAENHLRIQQCKAGIDEGDVCNLSFDSYTELKKYQKKVRLFTYSFSSTLVSALVIVFALQIFVSTGVKGATFTWNQTSWNSTPAGVATGHPDGQAGWTDYVSKDANLSVTNPAPGDSALTLSEASASVSQTDDGTAATGFNLAGKSFSQTVVNGTGSAANVQLTGTTAAVNNWDTVLKPAPSVVGYGSAFLRNGSDDKAYLVVGNNSTNFYEYTFSSNAWKTLANAPGTLSSGSVAIRNGSEDYIYVLKGSFSAGFYRYTISSNTWTTLSFLPTVADTGSFLIRDGSSDSIYAAFGATYSSFYKYSISTNSWTAMTSMPAGSVTTLALHTNGEDFIYASISGGFYRYSMSGNSWTTLAASPGVISGSGGKIMRNGSDDEIYAFAGNTTTAFYKYSISANSWTTLTAVPGNVGTGAVILRDGANDTIYVARGGTSNQFFSYSISSNSWTTLTGALINISVGGVGIRNGSDNEIYVLIGNNSGHFLKYSISGNSWTGSSNSLITGTPVTNQTGTRILRNGSDDEMYVTFGNGQNFYKYTTSTNSWTQLASLPFLSNYDGSSMLRDGSSDFIYLKTALIAGAFARYSISANSWTTLASAPATGGDGGKMIHASGSDEFYYLPGGNTANFYKYSISGNSWTTLTVVPSVIGVGSALLRDGESDSIYVVAGGNGTSFYRYSISGNSWVTLTALPGATSYGGGAIRNGSDDQIYVIRGNGSAGFYRYSISGNSWTTLTSPPTAVNYGGRIMRNGNDDEIYVLRAGGTAYFYRYSIASNTWTTLPNLPESVGYGGYMIRNGSDNEIFVFPGNSTTGFYRFIINQTTYNSSGTYTSGVMDLGINTAGWGNLTWTNSRGQTITLKARSCDDSACSGEDSAGKNFTSDCADISSGAALSTGSCVTAGDRYLQYQASLSTADTTTTPGLDDITLGYSYYPTNQTLVSSAYDSGSDANTMGSMSWTENPTLPSGTGVTFSVRTAPDQAGLTGTWNDIVTATCSKNGTTGVVTCPNTLLPAALRDSVDDRWFQYKVTLASQGEAAPAVSSISASYVVNAPPEVQNVTASEGNDGNVTVNYEVRDPDTSSGANSGHVISVLQYCDGTCTSTTDVDWKTASAVTYLNSDNSAKTNDDAVEDVNWNSYKIVWDAKQEYDGNYSDDFKVQVRSHDSEQANYYGYGAAAGFVLDTKNPSGLSLAIDHTQNKLTIGTPVENSSYQMAVSNLANLSDASDQAFQNEIVYGDLTTDPATVYLRIKDAYGNYAIIQAVTPAKPANVVYYDVSNSATEEYREFVAWDVVSVLQSGSGFESYKIYRSTDGTNFDLVDIINDRNTNYYLDNGLIASTHYYYKIRTQDTAGNISQYSSVIEDTPDGQGGTDQTAPTISAVQVLSIDTTSATVTWTTDELADSSVGYSQNTEYLPEMGVASMVSEHAITLTGLSPNTEYNIRIKSRDIAGNLGQNDKDNPGSSAAANFMFTTKSGPAISSVTLPEVSNTQATINWNTSTDSSTYVIYSTAISNGDLASPAEIGTPDLVGGSAPFEHSQSIAGLSAGTTYYFKVKSIDGAGNVAIDNNGQNFYQFTTTTDTTAPQIMMDENNPLVLTDMQAVVGFATSEKAMSRIGYKKTLDAAYTYLDWESGYNNDHAFVISGLENQNGYDYAVEVKDVNDNLASSAAYSLTTKATQVSHDDLVEPASPDEMVITDTKAVISQETNTSSVAKLCFGPNSIDNQDFANCVAGQTVEGLTLVNDVDQTLTHNFELNALLPNTTYHYRVYVEDSEKQDLNFSSADSSFTTKKVQIDQHDALSSIDTPSSADITTGTTFAFVSWDTDQLANSYLACSTSSGDENPLFISQNLADYQTNHTLKVLNLTPDTKYYCTVTSTDNMVPATSRTSGEFSFTTEKDALLNHEPLSEIDFADSNPSVLTDTDAVISFATDQQANCFIEYGTTTEVYDAVPKKETDDVYSINHNIHLLGLLPKTDYFYKVTCEDNIETTVSSDEKTFKTKDKLLTGDEWGTSQPGGDIVPPTISNIKVSSVTGESVAISWDTDENGNSIVGYGVSGHEENTAGDQVVNKDRSNYLKNHSVTINGLVPGTKYLFVVSSLDASGNIGSSSEESFSTSNISSLSSIKAESKNLGEATITWETDQEVTSVVEYGLATDYDEKKESSNYTKEHSITLSNLNQGQVYHYMVKGKDKSGRLYASADQTFEPKSPPKIKDIEVNGITEHEAIVSFKTNVPTTATATYTDIKNKEVTGAVGTEELATEHKLKLKNLDQGTTFVLKISVRDEQSSQSEEKAPDFTTGKDENPPKIDQVKTDSALTQSDKVQTIINWKTDEQATTALVYKESRNGEEKEVKITDNLTTGHVAVITTFKAGAVYYFKVKSIDASGNTTLSNEFALLTPRRKENIIQVIVNNFQDIFGWARR